MSKLNALHPALIVIENPGEYLEASRYPANTIKISSNGNSIYLFINVLKDNTKKWVPIGDNEGGTSIDGLNDEIANRIAADTELRDLIRTLVSQEKTSRVASDTEIYQAIETLDGRVDNIESDVAAVQDDLVTVQNNVSGVQNSLATVQNNVTGVQNGLTTVQNNVADVQSDLATVQDSVSGMQDDILAAQNDITDAKSSISTVQSDLTTAQGNIATVQSDLATAQDNITTVQSGLATAQGNIATIQSGLATAQSDIASVQEGLEDAQSSITEKTTQEATARQNADTALRTELVSLINQETSNRSSEDLQLSSAIASKANDSAVVKTIILDNTAHTPTNGVVDLGSMDLSDYLHTEDVDELDEEELTDILSLLNDDDSGNGNA